MKRMQTTICLLPICTLTQAANMQFYAGSILEYIGIGACIIFLLLITYLSLRTKRILHEKNNLQTSYNQLKHSTENLHKLETQLKQQENELALYRTELYKKENKIRQLNQIQETMQTELDQLKVEFSEEIKQKEQHPNQRKIEAIEENIPQESEGELLQPFSIADIQPWNSNDEFLTQIIQIMQKNIDNANIRIEDISKEMNISRSMLCRKIKATTGLTFVEFMHRVRITYSIELLKSDYTFSQIAYMTGFNDPKYFTKCFKRYTGLTPSEYREKRLQKKGNNKDILSHNKSYQFGNYLGEALYS